MLRFTAFALLLLVLISAVSGLNSEREYMRQFSRFLKQYNKQYTADSLSVRFAIFKANLQLISAHNSQPGQTSTMGVNELADMTSAEVAAKMTGYRRINRVRSAVMPRASLSTPVAEALDWNAKGAVTAIKNQGMCGSCWSFSATGAIEGAVYLKTGNLTSLSEQQLMDCSTKEGDTACEGGLMDYAFQYVMDNKGICSEADYPYKAVDEKCKKCDPVTTISSFADVWMDEKHPGNETALMAAVQLGPVSVAIEADQPIFQLYTTGVISSASCGGKKEDDLDHGVLVTGYGTDSAGVDYWIIKNSWGPKWGEKGFVRIIRDKNECGVNWDASYPIA